MDSVPGNTLVQNKSTRRAQTSVKANLDRIRGPYEIRVTSNIQLTRTARQSLARFNMLSLLRASALNLGRSLRAFLLHLNSQPWSVSHVLWLKSSAEPERFRLCNHATAAEAKYRASQCRCRTAIRNDRTGYNRPYYLCQSGFVVPGLCLSVNK